MINFEKSKIIKSKLTEPVSIAFEASNEASYEKISTVFQNEDTKLFFVPIRNNLDKKNFFWKSNNYITNPANSKSYNDVTNMARKHKTDLMFVVGPDEKKLGVAVKHQKRYKYFNSNQIAVLYIDYLLEKMSKEGKLEKGSFILTSVFTTKLIEKIALKYDVNVRRDVGVFSESIKQNYFVDEKFLFCFDENYLFETKSSNPGENNVFCVMKAFVEIFKNLNQSDIDIYEHLKNIYKIFGIHRTIKIDKEYKEEQKAILFKSISKAKNIGDRKILAEVSWEKEEKIVAKEVILNDGSRLLIDIPSKDGKFAIYLETVGESGKKLMDIVAFEKESEEFIDDSVEILPDKNWSWKTAFKYLIFISIISAIMVFVFMFVYKSANSSSTAVFSVFSSLYHNVNPWLWLTVWIWIFLQKFINSWAKKRMFQQLGEDVKLRHIFASQVMGSIIAFITPFAVGGDAVGYWYLRRKGVKRAPLISTLASATIWGELKYVIQTFILFAIGFNFYFEIFDNSNPQAHAALIMFFIGLAWGVFSSGMILTLCISKRIQEFIVRNTVKLLEWFPYYHITDPGMLSAGVQRQFMLIRNGTKKIWTSPRFILEMTLYDVVPMFFSPLAIIYSTQGLINPDVATGTYWSQIVAGDISGTANSLSITPGGSGTWEWLSVNINETLFKNTNLAITNNDPKLVASASDLLSKVIFNWPDLVLSSLTIFIALLTVRKNPFKLLRGRGTTIFSILIFGMFIIGLLLLIFLI